MREQDHPRHSSHLDESRGLLGDDDLMQKEDEAVPFTVDERSRQPHRISRVRILVALGFIATVIAAISILTITVYRVSPAALSQHTEVVDAIEQNEDSLDISSRGQIAIPLHPERHARRPPTTLEFQWNITRENQSLDGVEKPVYLVNGRFPGPTIEARPGDRIIVRVHNGLPQEGISLHWHGLELRGNNAMDGAVGYTQCPIPASSNWTYNFTIGAEEYGTFWWHSHAHAQRGDGLYGGLVVHEPHQGQLDARLEQNDALLLVSDWYHRSQADVVAEFRSKASIGSEPTPDSMLLNGYGHYNCSMANKYRPIVCAERSPNKRVPLFKSKKDTRLRIVNTGTLTGISVMMQGGTLRPFEVDGACKIDTQPRSSMGILYPGERVDAMLDWAPGGDSSSWFNVYLDPENFIHKNYALNPNQTFAALHTTLDSADDRLVAPPIIVTNDTHVDLSAIISSPANISIAGLTSTNLEDIVVMSLFSGPDQYHHGETRGVINGISWEPQVPPLLALNRQSWDEHQNVKFVAFNHSAPLRTYAIINNPDDGAHSFHLHGHSFHVLASFRSPTKAYYPGSYYPSNSAGAGGKLGALAGPGGWTNLDNPVRRDTVTVPRWGHVLISFVADNPGLWLMHCHMMVHQGAGMAAGFQVGDADDAQNVRGQQPAAAELCMDT